MVVAKLEVARFSSKSIPILASVSLNNKYKSGLNCPNGV